MEAKDLSKVKYIYRIYESSDEVLHCEKYPVIYINSKIVYFKTHSKSEFLDHEYIKNVLDNFVEFNQSKHGWHRTIFDYYFWNVETNIEEIYKDLVKQRAELKLKDNINWKYLRLEKAKQEYEAALKEIEFLENLKKILGEDKE